MSKMSLMYFYIYPSQLFSAHAVIYHTAGIQQDDMPQGADKRQKRPSIDIIWNHNQTVIPKLFLIE